MPLFDAYPGLRQPREVHSPLLNPILADIRALPPNMLFIIPTMDILVHEQTVFTDRLKKEADELNKTMDQIENEDPSKLASSVEAQGDSNLQMKKRASSKTGTMNKRPFRIETLFFENQLHGWLERMSYSDCYTLPVLQLPVESIFYI